MLHRHPPNGLMLARVLTLALVLAVAPAGFAKRSLVFGASRGNECGSCEAQAHAVASLSHQPRMLPSRAAEDDGHHPTLATAYAAEEPAQALEPRINEFSANTVGTEDVEYVEIDGAASADYSAYAVLVIEGDAGAGTGSVDAVVPVGATAADGLWLAGLPTGTLENGTLTLLLVRDYAGAPADVDTNDDGTVDIAPWSALADAVAADDGGPGDLTYGLPVLGPNYDDLSSFAPGGASRIPDGYDTDAPGDWVRNDFDLAGIPGYPGTIAEGEAYNTPGEGNMVYTSPAESCGEAYTPIDAIQGSGPVSPLLGAELSLEGVVVGDFQNNVAADDGDLNGIYVQDPTGDGDAATSAGIFVYAPAAPDVQTGDHVRVRGIVSEYQGTTEVRASGLWFCSGGHHIAPTELALPWTNLTAPEAYEGMRVTFPQALVVTELDALGRYGEIGLASALHWQPTALYRPGSPEALALAELQARDRLTLDDGRAVQYPDPLRHPDGAMLDLSHLLRRGDTLTGVTGVLDQSSRGYRIQPTEAAEYAAVNPRPAAPEEPGDSLKVASFNVLNYFTTIDAGLPVCGPQANQPCRGADTPEELERQRAKIVAALAAIDADIVGLIEIENHPGDAPVADLVAGLNDLVGAGTYSYIATGATGIDVIRQALIFKPATVMPLGPFAVLEDPTFTNPRGYLAEDGTLDQMNRPALAQSFLQRATEGVVTVAVNHLKSRSSPCGQGDDDPHQGNCNLTRTLGAQALASWLATDPTGSGDPDVLVIGDLNACSHEDPIAALTAAGYTDTLGLLLGDYAYSYVYDGQAGHLDYALAGPGLRTTGQVAGVTIWHINADEPQLIDYDMTLKSPAHDALYAPDPYRSSDHDPVIIGLRLTGPANRVYLPLVLR